MKKRPLLVVLPFLAMSRFGFGALGDTEQSVIADQTKFRAERSVVARQGYNVHEMTGADGTQIREYVSPSGQVFGVAWQGPTLPNLSQLLGSNFTEFQAGVRTQVGRRRVAVVRNNNLVVESIGHSRDFHGRAYLNSMLPNGVPAEVVQ